MGSSPVLPTIKIMIKNYEIFHNFWVYCNIYNKMNIMNPNHYKKQCERALKRKLELIEYKGGKCEICGYDKNIAAFEFHHKNPHEKSFQLDSRHLSNTSIQNLINEAEKCMLLCSNCHREMHNVKYDKGNLANLLLEYDSSNSVKLFKEDKKKSKCKYCGKEFPSVKGKIYCSSECRYNDKNYPSYDEIVNAYEKLKSWEKVAQEYNITRRILFYIRKNNRK